MEIIIGKTAGFCYGVRNAVTKTEEKSKKVQCMIIIGGNNSSNTKKLYDIAKENCKNTYIVETKDELDLKQIQKFNLIGIMAGASTPDESIQDVVNAIQNC